VPVEICVLSWLVFTWLAGKGDARTRSVAISARISTTSRAVLRFSTSGDSVAGGILLGRVVLGAIS
jgi:hypothetical protein